MTGRDTSLRASNIKERAGLPPFLSGSGDMRGRMRAHDWSLSPLGQPETWPQALRTAAGIMIQACQPMFVAWGRELAFLYNDGYVPIFGDKHPDALGKPFAEVWSDIWEQIAPLVERTLAGEASFHEDLLIPMERHGYREDAWFSFSYTPIEDENGAVAGLFCAAIETTQKVLAERREIEERERLTRMFSQAPSLMAMLRGPNHILEFVNPAYMSHVGPRDLIGRTIREAFPELEGQGIFELLANVYKTGTAFVGTALKVKLQRHPGSPPEDRYVDFVYQPITDSAGRISGIFVEGSDVTERVRGEQALGASQRRLDAVLDNASVAIFLMDERQHCSYMNAAAERLTGYTFAETQGRPLHEVVHHTHPDGRHFPIEECAIDRAFPQNNNTRGEEVFVHKDGSFYLVAFTASPIRDEEARIVGTIIEVRDIGAEKEAKASLLEESHTLETLNRIGSAVAGELDLERIVQMVTDAGVELTGAHFGAFFYNVTNEAGESMLLYTLSGAERSAFEHFGHPRATAVFAPTFKGEGVVRSNDILTDDRYGRNDPYYGMPKGHLPVRSYLAVPVTSRSGEVIGGLFFGHPEPGRFADRHERLMVNIAAQAAIAVDNARLFQAVQQANELLEQRVTERTAELETAHEALRQSQKMEAIGQLTGGLAHDFNNLLAGISGSLELMGTRIAQGRMSDVDRYLVAAQGAAKRAAALTHRLLAFSRRQTLDPKPTDVNRLVAGMEELIRRTVGPQVEIEAVAKAGLWSVLVDPNQLENALLNLCINARDAMPDGGRITIETGNRWLDERAGRERDLPPGQYVSLCVSDNGTGMPADVIERAFDPFFTTKPIGVGTGLGLSMIYGFVRQSGGQVRIYSEVSQGTMVCVYLPRHHAGEADDEVQADVQDVGLAKAGETVLVIDDEPIVRMLIVDVLEELGYAALDAGDGPEGLKVLRSKARIDLLITDVGLPNGMNGRQVADAARELRPGLKVLFVTGYAENAVLSHGHLDPGMQVVTKPFDISVLASRIKGMISGG